MDNEEKENSEAVATTEMSLYKGAKTNVKARTHFTEEFEANVGVHQGSVLSPLLLAIVSDAVTDEIKEGTLQEILKADDSVLISEIVVEPKNILILQKMHLRGKA